MEVLLLLIITSLLLAGCFLGFFVLATRSGQFDDVTTPAYRILPDDPPPARRQVERGKADRCGGVS